MVEGSPCLVRSFSQTYDSSSNQVDPLRALTTSVSFGRFESDSSSWEKWSCFSSNRYLEEAEKISKPGLVAEKKALLEAHFKKIGAKKALTETSNHEQSKVDGSCTDSMMILESSKTASEEVKDEMQVKGGPNVLEPDVESKEMDICKMEDVESETKTIDIVEKVIQCEVPKPPKNKVGHTECVSSNAKKMPIIDHAKQGKQSLSSSKLFTDIRASKFRSSMKVGPSQPNNEVKASQISKKTGRGSLEKKRSTLKSLHMSVDYSSRFDENSKRSTQMIQKTGDPKRFSTFSKTPRDTSTPRPTPTRVLTSVPFYRIKTLDKPSIPRNTAKSQSPAIDSKTHEHHKQSPTVASSPFSLRCEGRVAKRKEYFQKLEEKQKAKEAEKVHIQPKSKKKSDDDLKTMRQITNCSWKLSPNSQLDTELPNNHVKKAPLIQPQTPKLGKQLTSSMVLDNGSRPLLRSAKIDDATKEKSIRTPNRSSCTMLRKNIKENASPNIQRWL